MSLDLYQEPVGGHDTDLRSALAAAKLPVDDLTEDGRSFYRFSRDGETVGFGGRESYGECALLRSVVVMAERRGQGFGEAITGKLLAQAHDDGAKAVYLLTDTVAPFFESLGFRNIARDAAPAAILATRQAANLCPASAALMAKDL
ncbi:GNAT family N-acetyltransferase [Agrobacterium tumefaciens]|uniref:arsenic resistance N-acetyltransferase ArsN2 n=1 Tax=Agrobacterium TaxID=357 RepID=UPI00115DD0BA|nr:MULTISPECIES: arsenic resistance N-acetyltransferase ArsN2 [Agrobacterium]MDA5241577.1 arsenic resistance N-acetyltransferase ArsN2 [Agrobacterium sp. MAFF310724]MDA5249347.1 arsenic resistance N-acetyltransferase ArsN2 [Agrobacterium sp. MAFF210268]MDO3445690.1 arsenic resistance N-acetyltransferase ArsN2 [Agrobacterium sp. V1]TRB13797.1 GNAT family N-acetyltransferase [Agrobacterium tumefaciens]UNZ54288.1 arsenic resistance N-acetyltransferase ArsN2 [Agrobacterium tumefaciens]